MRYFVIHPNGDRFGPADLPTLNQWAHEGRMLPNSLVAEESTGRQMTAMNVAGIHFPRNGPGSYDPAHTHHPSSAFGNPPNLNANPRVPPWISLLSRPSYDQNQSRQDRDYATFQATGGATLVAVILGGISCWLAFQGNNGPGIAAALIGILILTRPRTVVGGAGQPQLTSLAWWACTLGLGFSLMRFIFSM